MFKVLVAALYGVVEGITEWLPISSTGHMLLLNEFVTPDVSEEFWSLFLVVIQLAAVCAVCVCYFHTLNPFSSSKSAEQKRATWRLWAKTLLACLPAAVLGILFDDILEAYLETPLVIASALIFYGVIFIVVENAREHTSYKGAHFAGKGEGAPSRVSTLDELDWKRALGIGLFQLLALVPGTSRSGATIIGGLILGCSRQLAAEFTFFLAIPVMAGASLLRLVKYILKGSVVASGELMVLAVGSMVAFVVSVAVVKFLISYIRKHDFKIFGWYRIVLGLAVITWFFVARGV